MEDLLIALERATNVISITYNKYTDYWTINYRNNLRPDNVKSDNLIDFLENA